MAGLKHDAAVCRQAAKSELVRHSLGILTTQEQADEDRRKETLRLALAKLAAKGNALPLE